MTTIFKSVAFIKDIFRGATFKCLEDMDLKGENLYIPSGCANDIKIR